MKPATHHVRTTFAALFGALAILLVLVSIVVVWLNQTLTNSEVFVNTVGPLAHKAAVQDFIASKASDQIIQNASAADLAKTVLPGVDVSSQSAEQTQTELKPALQAQFKKITSSPQFADIWQSTITSAQHDFFTQLDSDSATVNLNLHPAVVGVVALLKTTSLAQVSDKVQVKDDAGVVSLNGDKIGKIRTYYHDFKTATVVIVLVTLLLAVLAVVLSVHHMKTLRRMAVAVGVVFLVVAAAVNIPSFVIKSADPVQQKATVTIAATLLHNLQLTSLIAGLVLIVGAIVSMIVARRSISPAKRR